MKNKKSFTLIELIMAVVIGGIILYPLLGTFITATAKNPTADAFTAAVHLANYKMETVCNKAFGSISYEAQTAFGSDFSGYSSQVIVHYVTSAEPKVSVDPNATQYKWVKVVVISNNLPGGEIDLNTLVTDVTNQ